MPPNPGDNCKIKVAVRVRPFNRRGNFFFSYTKRKSFKFPREIIKILIKKSNCDRVRGK